VMRAHEDRAQALYQALLCEALDAAARLAA
jgi:hypothetical protein